jgi:plastocyanin
LRRNIAATAVVVGALLVAPASQAVSSKVVKKTVKVRDNFFSPDSLKVPEDTKVTWRWPKNPGDVHDVYLRKGPRGVKKFHSDTAASGYSFARTLKKPGKYSVICTFHEEMKMTIRVKK